jgi:hypothetical protein
MISANQIHPATAVAETIDTFVTIITIQISSSFSSALNGNLNTETVFGFFNVKMRFLSHVLSAGGVGAGALG